jgi:2',3'-cyclic-nucleotide 2'-phosphodiesterase (5'-nucleotidase family)
MNRRGIRIPALQQGDITIKDIYQMDPFQNEIFVFHMTVKEMETLIRYAYNLQDRIDLAVSGMTYTIAVDSSGKFRSVIMKDITGNPLDPEKVYSVALNSYIASSYRFDHRDPGYSTRIISEEILISYLEEVKKINYERTRRTFTETVN